MDISHKSETDFLGIYISQYMNWDAHVRSSNSATLVWLNFVGMLRAHMLKGVCILHIFMTISGVLILWGGHIIRLYLFL
jgi:hypothetical protein